MKLTTIISLISIVLATLIIIFYRRTDIKNEKLIYFLGKHKEEMVKNFQVKNLALFGSHAKNTATSKSDIDIIVEFKKVPSIYEAKENLRQFLETQTGKKIDIVSMKYIKPFAKEAIKKSSIKI